MEEIWKDIKGYEGYYQVSNLGRVRSLDKYIKIGGVWQNKKGVIRKPRINASGYYTIDFSVNKVRKHFLVARLVAAAFIPNPNNYPCVNHKDENRLNNFVWVNEDGTVDPEKSNLEWCTVEYNCNYGNHNKHISETQKKNYLKKVA